MQSTTAIILLAVICSPLLCSSYPQDAVVHEEKQYMSNSNSMSSANGFRVSTSQTNINGNCTTTLSIAGNGIRKVVSYPCKNHTESITSMNQTLLVDDEFYTDAPGTLIRVVEGNCVKEVFQEEGGQFNSTETPMEDKDCEEVKTKIGIMREQQNKWNEWYLHQQQQLQQQIRMIHQSLHTLQQRLLGGMFGMLHHPR